MIMTLPDPPAYDVYIGIDVDKKSYAVTYKERDQAMYKSFKIPACPSSLDAYFTKRFPQKRFLYAYETGPTGYHLYDYLTERRQSCIMVHPGNIQKAPCDKVKTNRLDSARLAKQLQGGELKSIHVPEEEYRKLRHLIGLRQQYSKDIARAKQRIKALLLFDHIELPEDEASHWSRRHLKTLKELKLDEVRRFKLDSFLNHLSYLRTELLLVHQKLKAFLSTHPDIQKNVALLRSIPGFGFVTSFYFLVRIGDPSHLGNVRQIGAFAGVVPSERSTGERIQKGPITHMGDPLLRSLLVEAAWVAISKDQELGEFYHRIKNRNQGSGGPQIAIVAVARKLTHRAHRVLKEQKVYIVH